MSNPVRQTCGGAEVEVYTDGSPLFSELAITKINGERVKARLSINDLHDIRYCIDRVLAQLPSGGPRP
jgi:hypothetical protein